MPPYIVKKETIDMVGTYETMDEQFDLPIKTVEVSVIDQQTGDVMWEKTLSNRFMMTGFSRHRSFDKRVVQTITRANLLASMLNENEHNYL